MNSEKLSDNNAEYYKMVKICGIEAGDVEEKIKHLLSDDNPKVYIESFPMEVHVIVKASSEDDIARKNGKAIVKEIKSIFGSNIYATDEDTSLEQSVVDLLTMNKLTVSTVESCTGGMVASRIIDVPGASEIFKEGFITYSNKSKKNRMGVKKSTLSKYGAVSEQTAKEMAKGCTALTKADVSISVTGIAGPTGESADKPIGLVYIGCCVVNKVKVKKYIFSGNRTEVRKMATTAALSLLRLCVLEYYSENNF